MALWCILTWLFTFRRDVLAVHDVEVPVIDVVVRQAQELHVEVVHPRGFVYVFEEDHLIALFQGAKAHKFRTYRFFYNNIQKFMLYPMLKIPCVPKPISTMTC